MRKLYKGTPIPRKISLVSGRNVLYPANVFALKIFLILNYKYCHNDNVRQIFPPTPKCHNDDIPNVSKLHCYYCKIRSLSMLSIMIYFYFIRGTKKSSTSLNFFFQSLANDDVKVNKT